MYDEFVFVEKYRPKQIEECILPTEAMNGMVKYIENGYIPNLLFTGSAGIGKTTLAIVLCRELDYEHMLINCSDEGRFLDTFRNKVASFCVGISIDGKRKCLILDEIDNLTHDVQSLLRGFIEKYSSNCSFIATCNFPYRLMSPLVSRFASVEFDISSADKKEVILKTYKRVCQILALEGVEFDKTTVSKLIVKFFPDFRRLLNELQKYSSGGKIDSGIFDAMTLDTDELIKMLKDRRWNDMRKWVASQNNLELHTLTKTLYTNAAEFMKNDSLPQLVLSISEFQYRNSFVMDKEINMVAFLTQIMSECEFV